MQKNVVYQWDMFAKKVNSYFCLQCNDVWYLVDVILAHAHTNSDGQDAQVRMFI